MSTDEIRSGPLLVEQQRDHARAMAQTLISLLNEFPTDIKDYDLPHVPAPGDGWDPLGDDD